jgi:cyclic pyranopterin monophosphate synthase
MVDVSAKAVSIRTATASARVVVSPAVIGLLRGGDLPKGDALGVARIAGIMAAKRTPRTADRTGVEMEALTAVSVAGLAVIDMVKGVDPGAMITDVGVLEKTGGVNGDWHRSS